MTIPIDVAIAAMEERDAARVLREEAGWLLEKDMGLLKQSRTLADDAAISYRKAADDRLAAFVERELAAKYRAAARQSELRAIYWGVASWVGLLLSAACLFTAMKLTGWL